MPRDKGGHGRTGSKHKAAAATREAAAAAQAAEQLTRPAPPAPSWPKRRRTASMEEQPATPADAAVQASAQVTEQLAKKTKKMVRFADELPTYRDGQKTLPGSAGWTWGRRWQQPYGSSFYPSGNEAASPDDFDPLELAYQADKLALQQHMTAVRVADYVAAGCIGPEPREWPDSADPWIERTHRRWCPLEHEHPGWRNAYVPQAHPHPGRCWCNLCIPGDPMIARVWYARSLYRSL